MKILVTGAGGFIGSSLCSALFQDGHDVLGLDLCIPKVGVPYHQIQCDLLTIDLSKILEDVKPDWILHCAGNANVGLSIQDPFMDLNGSYVLLHRLLYAIKAALRHARLLFLSSAAVYGNPEKLPITEAAPRNPVSPYGLHKAACEDLCDYFTRIEGLDCRVMRIFSAYGAGLRKQILWDLCAKIERPGKIHLFGTGAETRDFIHVDDVVNAARLILEKGTSGIYNVANGVEVRIDTIVQALLRVAGESEARISFSGESKPGDPLNWRADISKLKGLGYYPSMPLEIGIEKYFQWRQALE